MSFKYGSLLLLILLVLVAPYPAPCAESLPPPWPIGNVTFTVPFRQGNDTDVFLQLMRGPFTAATRFALGAKYISGRAGTDAWARMVDDPPDGSVITGINIPHIILRARERDSGVRPSNMGICAVFAYTPCVLWAPKDSRFTNFQAIVDAAAAMRGAFLVAGPGRYTASQAASRIIDRATGIRTTYVPYAGTGEAAMAVLTGKASVFWAHSVRLAIFSDAFVPVAVASEARLPTMPDTPTFKELGIDVSIGVFRGIAVPAVTPEKHNGK